MAAADYHYSYHHLFDASSPSCIPVNNTPNAAGNLEIRKFLSIPTKRNVPLQSNKYSHPAPATVTSVVRQVAEAAKKIVNAKNSLKAQQKLSDSQAIIAQSINDLRNIEASLVESDSQSQVSRVGGSSQNITAVHHLDFEAALLPYILRSINGDNQYQSRSNRATPVTSARQSTANSPERQSRTFLDRDANNNTCPGIDPDSMMERIRNSRSRADQQDKAVRTVSMRDAVALSDLENNRGGLIDSAWTLNDEVDNDVDADIETSRLRLAKTASLFIPTPVQWNYINELRIHAGAPERSEKGIDMLARYYAQLRNLEGKFPIHSGKIQIDFTWYEAFAADRQVITPCIQYEKASVLFNMAAVLSHLGSSQQMWTKNGKKYAAAYFQKSAGVLLHIRDTIFQRIQMRLDKGADLAEKTLSALAQLMLAQAMECFLDKANEEKTSSPIMSMIAAQTADYFESAISSAKDGIQFIGRQRFPRDWIAQMSAKANLTLAIAHFHAPLQMVSDQALGERISRLSISKNLALQAAKMSKEVGGPLHEIVKGYVEVISSAHLLADAANFEKHNHPIIDVQLVSSLRRPTESLVRPVPFDTIVGDLERHPDIFASFCACSIEKDLNALVELSARVVDAGRAELKSCYSEIASKIASLEDEKVNANVSKGEDETTMDHIPLATLMHTNEVVARNIVQQIKLYEKEESVLQSREMMNCLEKLHEWVANNLHESAAILEDADLNKIMSSSNYVDLLQYLRKRILETNELANAHRVTLQHIREIYTSQIADFNPAEWSEEKLRMLLPCLEKSRSISTEDAIMEKHREAILSEQKSLLSKLSEVQEECKRRLLEIEEFGDKISNIRDDIKRSANSILPARRLQLTVIEEAVSSIRKDKDALLTRISQLSQSLKEAKGIRREEENSMEIITGFKISLDYYAKFRDMIQKEINDCSKLREESVEILAQCMKLPRKSGGDDGADEQGSPHPHPLGLHRDPMLQQYLEHGSFKSEKSPTEALARTAAAAEEDKVADVEVTDNNAVGDGVKETLSKDKETTSVAGQESNQKGCSGADAQSIEKIGQLHSSISEQTRETLKTILKAKMEGHLPANLSSSAHLLEASNMSASEDYLRNLAIAQQEEILRLFKVHVDLQREAREAGLREKKQRDEVARLGNLAWKLLHQASKAQGSAAGVSGSQPSNDKVSSRSKNAAHNASQDIADKPSILKGMRNDGQHSTDESLEGGDLTDPRMKRAMPPLRRPVSSPVRFVGVQRPDSSDGTSDSQKGGDSRAGPSNQWTLSGAPDKIRKGLLKLVKKNSDELDDSEIEAAISQDPDLLRVPHGNPFGNGADSRKSSYGTTIELQPQSGSNNRSAYQERKVSTASGIEGEWYDAEDAGSHGQQQGDQQTWSMGPPRAAHSPDSQSVDTDHTELLKEAARLTQSLSVLERTAVTESRRLMDEASALKEVEHIARTQEERIERIHRRRRRSADFASSSSKTPIAEDGSQIIGDRKGYDKSRHRKDKTDQETASASTTAVERPNIGRSADDAPMRASSYGDSTVVEHAIATKPELSNWVEEQKRIMKSRQGPQARHISGPPNLTTAPAQIRFAPDTVFAAEKPAAATTPTFSHSTPNPGPPTTAPPPANQGMMMDISSAFGAVPSQVPQFRFEAAQTPAVAEVKPALFGTQPQAAAPQTDMGSLFAAAFGNVFGTSNAAGKNVAPTVSAAPAAAPAPNPVAPVVFSVSTTTSALAPAPASPRRKPVETGPFPAGRLLESTKQRKSMKDGRQDSALTVNGSDEVEHAHAHAHDMKRSSRRRHGHGSGHDMHVPPAALVAKMKQDNDAIINHFGSL
ncbi:Rhophilin, Rho GTPase binding protein [Blyttiomyces sp. JEL0837]|nr:Rhophilin, Rho GTPase binding protein [Blyttiomyces sp. JEL0837]